MTFISCDTTFKLIPDLLMTAGLFVGGFGTNPKIPFFGGKPTFYMNYLNKKFIETYIGVPLPKRKNSLVIIDEKEIHSGDLLMIMRMDGID